MQRAHHVIQGTWAAFIFDLDWIFETGSHCSLDWSRTHCVSQTTLTPLQSSCFSLPSSGMTGIGHHAQLEHPQIFIPKGGPEINPLLPLWDKCVCLICSLILEVPAFSESARLCSSIASNPLRNCSSFPERFCLYTPRSSTRSPVSPHPHPGLCSSLLGPHHHSGGRSKMNWSPLVSASSMCFFLGHASLFFEKVCWFVDSGCVSFLTYSLPPLLPSLLSSSTPAPIAAERKLLLPTASSKPCPPWLAVSLQVFILHVWVPLLLRFSSLLFPPHFGLALSIFRT